MLITRRAVLAAAGTLPAVLAPRKPRAGSLPPLQDGLRVLDPPVPVPDFGFVIADGARRRLSDFTGRGMVVNFWATWCAPCIAELPSLATLSKALAPDDIATLPLSSDRGGAAVVRDYFEQHQILGLPVMLDPLGDALAAIGARGIPTTLIIDRAGRERARLDGAADWSAPSAASIVRRLAGSG